MSLSVAMETSLIFFSMTTSAGLKGLDPSTDNNNHRIEDQDNNNNNNNHYSNLATIENRENNNNNNNNNNIINQNSSLATIEDRDQLYKSVLEKSYGSSLITPAENINEIRRCPIQVLL